MKQFFKNAAIIINETLKSQKFWKFVVTVCFLVALSFGILLAFEKLGLTNPDKLAETLSGLGFWLYVIYIGLYLVQSILLCFVPGNTTLFVTIGFFLFGDFWTALIVCSIAIMLSSCLLYFVGRYGGRNLMYWLFGKEAVEQKLQWIGEKGIKAVPWFFLIPMMPTDLICLICGASKMRFWQFMLIVCVFRPVEVTLLISYSYIVPYILSYEPLIIILVINIVIIDIVLLFLYYKAIMKVFQKYAKSVGDQFMNPIRKYNEKHCVANVE
ncbi:MAG: VTT domain-containing protein [Firmicutes bacterium]|nr:VTT domain-containing protein [Bacillota bacterium]